MEIVHNHDNDHLDWLFHKNIFPLPKGSDLRNYLEVYSLSSDQVFLSIPLKTFQSLVDRLLNVFLFFCFLIVVWFISYTYDQKQLSS